VEIKATDVKELKDKIGAGLMDCKKALIEAKGDIVEAANILKKKGMAKAEKKSGREATEGAIGYVIGKDGKEAAIVEVRCETDFVARSDTFQAFLQAFASGVMAEKVKDPAGFSEVKIDGKPAEDARHSAVLKLGENIQLCRGESMAASGVFYGYSHGNKIGVVVALEKSNDQLGKDIAMHIAALSPAAITEKDLPEGVLKEERAIYEAQLQDSNKPAEIKDKIIAGKLKKFASGMCLYGQPFVKDPKETIEDILKRDSNHVKSFVRYELGEQQG